MIDLATELPRLFPLAVEWAESQSQEIRETGFPLTSIELKLARSVGVERAEQVRVKIVPAIPQPINAELHAAAIQLGLLGPSTHGLTLGHSIYLVQGYIADQLIQHECRHVYQYEQAGSIEAFLARYIPELVQFGYERVPYEIDARAHEGG